MNRIKAFDTCKAYRIGWRALAVALSTFILGFTGTVYAATVDDLREIVGTGRLDTPENRALLSRIVYMYSNQQHNQQLMDTINDSDMGTKIIENMRNKEKEIKELNSKINSSFKTLDAMDLIALYREADTVVAEYKRYNPDWIRLSDDSTIITEEEYNKAVLDISRLDDKSEIGVIGDALRSFTGTRDVVVDIPFGDIWKEYNDPNNEEIEHSNGVYLENGSVKYEVKNPLKGVVSEVGSSEVLDKYVVLTTGGNLSTVIGLLDEVTVNIGDEVEQYGLLGKSKKSSIYFEVILDGEYIDPLKIYGKNGVEAYYKWRNSNSERVIEDPDYSMVKGRIDAYNYPEYDYEIEDGYTVNVIDPER